jgi:hypothetical protein
VNRFTRDELFRELHAGLHSSAGCEASPDGMSAHDALQIAWELHAETMPKAEMSAEEYEEWRSVVRASARTLLAQAYRRSLRRLFILLTYQDDSPRSEQEPDALQQLAARQVFLRIFQELAVDPPAFQLLAVVLPKRNATETWLDYKDTAALCAYFKCSAAEITNIKKRLARAARRVLDELDGSAG